MSNAAGQSLNPSFKYGSNTIDASTRVAIVGGGKMGEALLSGWLAAQKGVAAPLSSSNIVVVNPGQERRSYLTETYGVRCVADSSELTETDVIVLAVKPQIMPTVLPVVSHVPGCEQALVISIAAGLNTSTIEQGLPNHIRVVRAMPNTPLLVGMGATTLCAGSCASEQDMALARDLFGCIGMALIVDESLMDVTGAINGSGPAYVAALVEAMAAGAVEQGLSADVAESLAIQTVVGTGSLMALKHQSAKQTRIEVCSPGGTTLAALDAMETGGFSDSIRSGVKAAVRRSRELGAQ